MKNANQKSTRKIITMTFITLDGVMQAAGSHEEGFEYGGWEMPFQADEIMGSVMAEYMKGSFELLLGRKTYDVFASFWPSAPDFIEAKKPFNETKKYVVSQKEFDPKWQNSFCITGDVVSQINKLKEEDGPDLWVHVDKPGKLTHLRRMKLTMANGLPRFDLSLG
tara:strand:+ start:5606 stop:6100 length:495 start_codon:yes stop_codon:yes gene_type:complete